MPLRSTGPAALVVIALLSFTAGGCGGDLFSDVLIGDGGGSPDALSPLTAGDLADAFDQFRNGISDGADRSQTPGLSNDQRVAVEELQRQLDAGEITQEEFVASVANVLQDTAANSPFAGFRFLGSPFSAEGANDFAELLGLTEEQRQQGLLLYRLLHGDIAEVRNSAKEQIRTLLSTQQQLLLDQLSAQLFSRVGLSDEQRAGAQLVFELLVERLGLTLDQQMQVEAVRDDMRLVVQQLHGAARGEFLALLGGEQLALLSSLE